MSPISKINVYSQIRGKRVLVGELTREQNQFRFQYDRAYQNLKSAIALGPEFPLWQKQFSSDRLFPTLVDRIPSRQNPAFRDYCQQWGVDENETEPFVLLTTIGHRGPSSFIFEAAPDVYTGEKLRKFRERLELNQREFARLLGITQKTVVSLENRSDLDNAISLYIELCEQVPEALMWLLKKRGQFIHDDKRDKIERNLLK